MTPDSHAPTPYGPVEQMIRAARSGSVEALGELLQSFRQYMLLVANDMLDPHVRPKGGCSDIVQDAFLKAQQDFGEFRGQSPGEFVLWLRAILEHSLFNFQRMYVSTGKRDIHREIGFAGDGSSCKLVSEVASESPLPEQQLVLQEELAALERALARLPDHYRQVILLRKRDGLSFEEIGQQLNSTPEAVRKWFVRGITRLQEELNAEIGGHKDAPAPNRDRSDRSM